MTKQMKIIIGAIIVAVVVAGIFLKGKSGEVKPLLVKKGDVVEATYAVGTVKADKVYNLKTGVSSRMLERFVRLGDAVKKGASLVRIDSFPLFTAPFDGVITALNYEVGELVLSQSPVLTLTNTKDLYLELSLDERSVSKVKVGDLAKISFSYQKKITTGKVRAVFAKDDQFYAHLDFDHNQMPIYPGMTCDVSIKTNEFKDSILVPIEAISLDGEVKLKESGKLIKLDIIYRDDKYAVVKDAQLSEGTSLELKGNGNKDSVSKKADRR